MRKFYCGTPRENCNGANVQTPTNKITKLHASPKEAFNCYKSYLINMKGYKQVGQREFLTPEGTTLVLDKKGNFGQPYRLGKRGEGGMKGNNFVPKKGKKGNLSGFIF